jgi:AAA+ ATPase superfamily predicted ATPase
LHHEVAEIGSYFSLIRVIAAGNRKLADIASVLGAKQTGLTGYLRTLIDLGILRRETPVTEKNPEKSKRGRYHIDDPFLEFWFKFVYPYRGQIETGHADIVENKIKESFIERHVAYIYEDVCREEIWRLSAEGRLPHRFDKVGAWWDGQDEIDICATSESSGTILFGECKYRNAKMDTDVFSALKTKAQKVPLWQEERKEIYALFSISGFTKQLKELAQKRDDLYLFE